MILALALIAASTAHIDMSDIQARLFYADTGRLSEDVLSRKKPFVFWNTIIGEGDAEEKADDLLVSVTLSVGKFRTPEENEQNLPGVLTIKATDQNGKVLGIRNASNLLTSTRGSTTVGLWLNDVTCAGTVTVQAKYADQVKSAVLELACGE
jgi:hypothetical protein